MFPVLNLGLAGAGPRAFLNTNLLAVINHAEFAVIQVLSGRSESNSAFDNAETGGTHGMRLRDRKKMRFEDFIEVELAHSPRETVEQLVEETRDNWVARYRELLQLITVPKVLLWFSAISPDRTDDYSSWWKLLGPFPQLVNRRMINQIRPFCDTYVESVCPTGLPQRLWLNEETIDGTQLRNGRLFNVYYPTQEMHDVAARELLPLCKEFLSGLLGKTDKLSVKWDVVVISSNCTDGKMVAKLCGTDVTCLTYRQLSDDRGLVQFLASRNSQIVHISRHNLLEGYIADRIGAQSRPLPPVDPTEFISNVKATLLAETQIAESCGNNGILEIFYEDLAANASGTAGQIAAFLKKRKSRKITAILEVPEFPRASEIPNLDELRSTLIRAAEQFTKDSG
jgi:hypothetical protein